MPRIGEAFYIADGERFASTELTRGPWDPDSQHAGPPAALLGRELQALAPAADGAGGSGEWLVGRLTFEILRPVPIAPLRTSARVVRPGRSVELVEGSLHDERGELMRARAWRLRRSQVELPAGLASEDESSPARRSIPLPSPDEAAVEPFFDTGRSRGYHTAMDYRFVSGGWREKGPATVWMRMRQSLVLGEHPSPLERVLVAADSANGVSATLDWDRYLFINVDLGVHLHRLPVGEWVGLDALTIPEPSGLGLAEARLHDERGPIGRALQTLLVRERGL